MRTRIFAHITILLSFLIWFLTLPLRVLPIRRRRIVLFAHGGGSSSDYVCNPKYICEGILGSEWSDSVELIWLGSNKNSSAHDRRIRWVNVKSLTGIYYLLSSGVIITNGPLFSWFPFRKKQFCLNTWHGGGAYKKLPSDIHRASLIERFKRMMLNRNVDVFLSSSRAFSDYVLRDAMCYRGEILNSGMPRNDLLLRNSDSQDKHHAIMARIGIDLNTRVMLFAPTFRDQTFSSYDPIDVSVLLESIEHHCTGKWVLLYRNHRKSESANYLFNLPKDVIDVSDYDDVQELLLIADFFITDYSSGMWDYSLTGRPGLLYIPDWEEYSRSPGLYLGLNELPFEAAHSMVELVSKVEGLDFSNRSIKSLDHINSLGSYEKGRAASMVIDRIAKIIFSEKDELLS